MGRTDQWIGLNPWALELLARQATSEETLEWVDGAWNESIGTLDRYTLEDGRVLVSFVQATPWSSGPMFFTALREENGPVVRRSLWRRYEMEEGGWRQHDPAAERARLGAEIAREERRVASAEKRGDTIGVVVYGEALAELRQELAVLDQVWGAPPAELELDQLLDPAR